MKQVFILAVIIVCSMFVGCSKTAVPVDISKVCAPDNEKKYVQTSGFIDDKGSIFCSNIGGGRLDCSLDVTASPGGNRVFGAEIEQGSGANTVDKLKSGYRREEIKIRDSAGSVINLAEKVRLTGKMNVTPDRSVCFLQVTRIDR